MRLLIAQCRAPFWQEAGTACFALAGALGESEGRDFCQDERSGYVLRVVCGCVPLCVGL